MRHVMTAIAYERKPALGGGFRAKVKDKRSAHVEESPVFPSKSEAIYWARTAIANAMGETPYAPGYRYKPDWIMIMNIFVD